MNKIAIVIPARYASTRFPGKPLHVLAGRPLIQHVWQAACRVGGIAEVIVATDDERIAACAEDFGAVVRMTRGDHPTGTDRVAEVAAGLQGFSHVLNVQGDEPTIDPDLLERLAESLSGDPSLPMITACCPFHNPKDAADPNAVKVVRNAAGDALYFSRSPIPYDRDGAGSCPPLRHLGVYGYRVDFLLEFVRWPQSPLESVEKLEQLRALERGARIGVIRTERETIGVDTPEDAERVEALLVRESR